MTATANKFVGQIAEEEFSSLFDVIENALGKGGDVEAALAALKMARVKVKAIEGSLGQVIAQVVRPNDYGDFYISPEAEDILKEAAKIACISWTLVSPPFNKRHKEFGTKFALERTGRPIAITMEPYRYVESLIREAAMDPNVKTATAIDPSTKEVLHQYRRK